MKALYESVYDDLTLKTAGILLGILLIVVHALAIWRRESLGAWLQKMPRNKNIGVLIFALDTFWAWILVSEMDLGEFYTIERFLQILVPVTFILVINFVDEFLAVRAIGILLLLAATPVLNAAFLEVPASRLLLPVLAYAWIVIGLFWVGMPYLMRDQIKWLTSSSGRWNGACAAGAGYGVIVLAAAVLFYGAAS
jgi:hypothetical protein